MRTSGSRRTAYRSGFRILHRTLDRHVSMVNRETTQGWVRGKEVLLCSAQPPGWWTKV